MSASDSCYIEKEKANENVCINDLERYSARESILEAKKKSTASTPWIYLESYLKWKLMDSSALAEIKLIINLEFQHDVAGTYHC